jgi:hypothetical protein
VNQNFGNPNHLSRDEALALFKQEAGNVRTDSLPDSVIPVDNPDAVLFDRSNVVAAARVAVAMAEHDRNVTAIR